MSTLKLSHLRARSWLVMMAGCANWRDPESKPCRRTLGSLCASKRAGAMHCMIAIGSVPRPWWQQRLLHGVLPRLAPTVCRPSKGSMIYWWLRIRRVHGLCFHSENLGSRSHWHWERMMALFMSILPALRRNFLTRIRWSSSGNVFVGACRNFVTDGLDKIQSSWNSSRTNGYLTSNNWKLGIHVNPMTLQVDAMSAKPTCLLCNVSFTQMKYPLLLKWKMRCAFPSLTEPQA